MLYFRHCLICINMFLVIASCFHLKHWVAWSKLMAYQKVFIDYSSAVGAVFQVVVTDNCICLHIVAKGNFKILCSIPKKS
jgi:hypothetical protein